MPESSDPPVRRSLAAGGRQLAELLEDLARALEHTARLADEHAARRSAQVDAATHDTELRRADRARSYAALARSNAAHILRSIQDRAPSPLPGEDREKRPPVTPDG